MDSFTLIELLTTRTDFEKKLHEQQSLHVQTEKNLSDLQLSSSAVSTQQQAMIQQLLAQVEAQMQALEELGQASQQHPTNGVYGNDEMMTLLQMKEGQVSGPFLFFLDP